MSAYCSLKQHILLTKLNLQERISALEAASLTERKQSARERKQAHELESAFSELHKKNREQEAVVAALREKGIPATNTLRACC